MKVEHLSLASPSTRQRQFFQVVQQRNGGFAYNFLVLRCLGYRQKETHSTRRLQGLPQRPAVPLRLNPPVQDLVAWIIPKDVLSLVFSTLGVV